MLFYLSTGISDTILSLLYLSPGGTQKGKDKGKGKSVIRERQFISEDKADKRGKKTAVVFSDENEQKLVDFLRDNEILCVGQVL